MAQYKFISYCGAGALANVTPEQARKLTHLNIAFGIVDDDLLINVDAIRNGLTYVKQLKKYNPNLNIMLSTGGGALSQRLCHGNATRTPEGIERLVKSTMDIIREYDLDGVDCDWEFPCWSGDMTEKYQHTALMNAYRKALDEYAEERGGRKCWLSIAAGCSEHYISCVEIEKLVGVLDYINLMCYDFRWESKVTGHQCNTFAPNADDPVSAAWAVEAFHKAGFPYEGLIVGAAFYSHRYDGVKGGGNGYGQPYDGLYSYGPSYTAINLIYEKSTEWVKYWDDVAKEPWLFNGESFITYDDPQAMKYKAEYVKEKGLGGIMYWEHSSDNTGLLFDAIYDNLMI